MGETVRRFDGLGQKVRAAADRPTGDAEIADESAAGRVGSLRSGSILSGRSALRGQEAQSRLPRFPTGIGRQV